MGLVASCCALQACWCCIGAIPCCCGAALNITKSMATRVTYTAFFLLLSLLAWIFEIYTQSDLWHIPFFDCSTDSDCGTYTVYKVTFALFVYHLLLSILLVGVKNSKNPRAMINDGMWPLKLFFLFGLVIADFFIPDTFFYYFAWVSLFGAGIFIIIQLVLLVDLAYSWSESWVTKWQAGEIGEDGESNPQKMYCVGLFFFAGLFYLISAGLVFVNYFLFCSGEFWWNSIIITAVLLMCIVLSVCSVLPRFQEFNHRIGLLQASIFTLFSSYFVYSAILSEPNLTSWLFTLSDTNSIVDYISLIFGAIFTVVSVVYASFSVGTSKTFKPKTKEDSIDDSIDADEGENHSLSENESSKNDDEKNLCRYNYSIFHFAFALGAMYLCMLLTNWSVISNQDIDTAKTDSGWVAVSIKIVSCFLAGGLYMWTIFAPAILPNRDWDY